MTRTDALGAAERNCAALSDRVIAAEQQVDASRAQVDALWRAAEASESKSAADVAAAKAMASGEC